AATSPLRKDVVTLIISSTVFGILSWRRLMSSELLIPFMNPKILLPPPLPNLLNTPLSFDFCHGDLDRSRLILENTLGLGFELRELLYLCLFSCSLVLTVLDSEYCDVL
ncbi:hypothetical protein Tco_1322919, partial [Tanacetum coccineum]